MLRNYLLTAYKVFLRRKLFTAINLGCIVLTLVVLMVITAHKAGVLVVDSGAAFNGKGPQPAFKVEDGMARKLVLNLGASDGKVVEVVSGARAGERLIVSSTDAFKDKDSIRISN